MTCPWFSLSFFHLSYSVRLKRGDSFHGGHEAMAHEMDTFLYSDQGVRKVVFASADDPPFMDARLNYAGKEHDPMASRVEYASILALSGFEADARYRLNQLRKEIGEDAAGGHWRPQLDLVSALQDCIAAHGDVRTVIRPLTLANKALAKVKPIKRLA